VIDPGRNTTGGLTVHLGISPWLTLPASLAVTMVAAGLIGAITVRLSGHYLPLGTIAWGIAFFYLFGNVGWLGAHDGLDGIPPLRTIARGRKLVDGGVGDGRGVPAGLGWVAGGLVERPVGQQAH